VNSTPGGAVRAAGGMRSACAACTVMLSGLGRKFVGGLDRLGGRVPGWSAEVEVAGAVEGVFGAAGEASGGQDLVLVLAAAVEVKGEAPDAG